MAEPVKRLTFKQRNFVDKYIEHHGNGSKAARESGYAGSNNVMEQIAFKNTSNPYIAAAIQARMEAQGITADMVIAELGRVAFADWKDFVKIKYGRDGHMLEANMDMSSKVRSLELLGKHFRLFADKLDITTEEVVRILEYVPPKGLGDGS
jgi:phage terminase small subunit